MKNNQINSPTPLSVYYLLNHLHIKTGNVPFIPLLFSSILHSSRAQGNAQNTAVDNVLKKLKHEMISEEEISPISVCVLGGWNQSHGRTEISACRKEGERELGEGRRRGEGTEQIFFLGLGSGG